MRYVFNKCMTFHLNSWPMSYATLWSQFSLPLIFFSLSRRQACLSHHQIDIWICSFPFSPLLSCEARAVERSHSLQSQNPLQYNWGKQFRKSSSLWYYSLQSSLGSSPLCYHLVQSPRRSSPTGAIEFKTLIEKISTHQNFIHLIR